MRSRATLGSIRSPQLPAFAVEDPAEPFRETASACGCALPAPLPPLLRSSGYTDTHNVTALTFCTRAPLPCPLACALLARPLDLAHAPRASADAQAAHFGGDVVVPAPLQGCAAPLPRPLCAVADFVVLLVPSGPTSADRSCRSRPPRPDALLPSTTHRCLPDPAETPSTFFRHHRNCRPSSRKRDGCVGSIEPISHGLPRLLTRGA